MLKIGKICVQQQIKLGIFIKKKVEQEGVVNLETIQQEKKDDKLNIDNIDKEEEVNPYQNIIINAFDRENVITSQMEKWSKLSNLVN